MPSELENRIFSVWNSVRIGAVKKLRSDEHEKRKLRILNNLRYI